MNIEQAAATILQRGVALDNKGKFTESLVCYQEGLQLLVDVMKGSGGDKKNYLRGKIEEYMTRAENIKKHIAHLKDVGKFHEQLHIENDSVGHSYDTVFGRFLDEDVIQVQIEDPYIRNFHQCQNLVRCCALFVKRCKNLKTVDLITTKDVKSQEQSQWLEIITKNLLTHSVQLKVSYSETLHDRQITLSSGWVIKIGRGLDYFKAPENRLSLGAFELDFRPCHETTVDVFHTKDVKLT